MNTESQRYYLCEHECTNKFTHQLRSSLIFPIGKVKKNVSLPFALPMPPRILSQLKPMVGTVFRYWSNLSRYNAVVFPALSRPSMATWSGVPVGSASRKPPLVPLLPIPAPIPVPLTSFHQSRPPFLPSNPPSSPSSLFPYLSFRFLLYPSPLKSILPMSESISSLSFISLLVHFLFYFMLDLPLYESTVLLSAPPPPPNLSPFLRFFFSLFSPLFLRSTTLLNRFTPR